MRFTIYCAVCLELFYCFSCFLCKLTKFVMFPQTFVFQSNRCIHGYVSCVLGQESAVFQIFEQCNCFVLWKIEKKTLSIENPSFTALFEIKGSWNISLIWLVLLFFIVWRLYFLTMQFSKQSVSIVLCKTLLWNIKIRLTELHLKWTSISMQNWNFSYNKISRWYCFKQNSSLIVCSFFLREIECNIVATRKFIIKAIV